MAKSNDREMAAPFEVSFWGVSRIVFVIFSLYLMGDTFYRWDGFSYYGTFYDFLPSIALIIIIWSMIALFASAIAWLFIRSLELVFDRMGRKVNTGYIFLLICSLIISGIIVVSVKQALFQYVAVSQTLKISLSAGVVLVLFVMSWLLRNKTAAIQERLTPLVWIFGTLFFLSVPLLGYHMLADRSTDNVIPGRPDKSSVSGKGRPNIILVTFDALTARNMSAYGYERETTPYISQWAGNATIFMRAEAEANYTAPATASLMTGKRVWSHRLYQPHGYKIVNGETENLPLLLKKAGYYNIAMIQNLYASVGTLDMASAFDVVYPVHELYMTNSISGFIDYTLYKYFSHKVIMYDWLIRRDFVFGKILNLAGKVLPGGADKEYPPEKVFDKFLLLIKQTSPEPFFAWLHVMPPHDPYLPPEPYMGMFDPSAYLRTFQSQTMKNKKAHLNTTKARYDEYVKYCDTRFGAFMDQLERTIDDYVFILSSDHGEIFGKNYIGHGGPHLYEELTHIPLIIKEPAQTEKVKIESVVEQIDIAPTILELANIRIPLWMEGRSLLPAMRGRESISKPALSMSLFNSPSGNEIDDGTFAIWDHNYKLIHYLVNNKTLLFDLENDPGEENNIADQEPVVSGRLLTLIRESLERANESIRSENTR